MSIVREACMAMDGGSGSMVDLLWMAQFLTEHCHIGAFALLWHANEWVECAMGMVLL